MQRKIVLSLSLAMLLSTNTLAEDTAVSIDGVSVDTKVETEETGIGSKSVVSAKKIEITSSAELLNPYKAISLEAGVDIRSNDPFGMSVTHKIRGKANRNNGETMEGLPLKGIGPGGGLSTLMDMENVSSISVEKGAIKADSGFGYGNDSGMVDMKMQKPSKEFSTEIKQAVGSYDFSKTYLRVDSGEMADIAKVFVSASLTEADKFKGSGKAPERKNFAMGVSSTSSQAIEWEIYGIYNDEKKHNYKGLSYAQSKDLSQYKNEDFQNNNSNKWDYYDKNKEDFQTYTIFAKIKAPLGNNNSLTFRPYFLNDKGYSYTGSAGTLPTDAGNVIEWLVNHDTYGAVLEYAHQIDNAKLKVGYWYQEDEPPGPPTSRKLRDANGLTFKKWERIVNVDQKHIFKTPYLTYEQPFGNTIVEAGLKYLWLSSPTLTSYNTAGIGDVDYKTALAQVSAVDFTLPSSTYEVFLPNLGITHYLNDDSYVKASYGRNYNTPEYSFGGGMINYFNKLKTKYAGDRAKAETDLQKMWANIKPEESENFDIGYAYNAEKFSFEATLFYSQVKNLSGSFYEPILGDNVFQNTGKAESYGLELAGGYQVLPALLVSASATYNNYALTENIKSGVTGATIEAKGNQRPDVPLYFGNISAEYNLKGFKFTPILRYLGERYVDVMHEYSVDESYLVDLTISKEFTFDKHKLLLSVACTNLLDSEYISGFGTSDTRINQFADYTVGAPRTFFASLSYKY